MVTDEMFDRASKADGKSAAVGSRIESQGVATGDSDKGMSGHENPIFIGSSADNGISGARDRTGDLGFMKSSRKTPKNLENPLFIESTPYSQLLQVLSYNRVSERVIAVFASSIR